MDSKKEKAVLFMLPLGSTPSCLSPWYTQFTKKSGCPCRLHPPSPRLWAWPVEDKSPKGTSLPGLTYLDVTCLTRVGVELMGVDKDAGLKWPKGDELTGLGSKCSWGKFSPGEKQLLNLTTSEPCLKVFSDTLCTHERVQTPRHGLQGSA